MFFVLSISGKEERALVHITSISRYLVVLTQITNFCTYNHDIHKCSQVSSLLGFVSRSLDECDEMFYLNTARLIFDGVYSYHHIDLFHSFEASIFKNEIASSSLFTLVHMPTHGSDLWWHTIFLHLLAINKIAWELREQTNEANKIHMDCWKFCRELAESVKPLCMSSITHTKTLTHRIPFDRTHRLNGIFYGNGREPKASMRESKIIHNAYDNDNKTMI